MSLPPNPCSLKPCALIPCYDNPATIAAVVSGCRVQQIEVIVIDDGSHIPVESLLTSLEGVKIHRHSQNLGKGASLARGLSIASSEGYTHAIALDADGQHLPDDIPSLITAIEQSPKTLWLGHRDLQGAGAGKGSRVGNTISNFWTWVETGLRLPDTQTGFRVYPTASIGELQLRTTGYDYEIEVLVKASWAGIPIDSIPISVRYLPDGERVSHLKPIRDFLRISRLNTHLVCLRIAFPMPYLELLVQRQFATLPFKRRLHESFRELLLREPGSPRRIAGSVGLGLFFGIAPFWGFQMALVVVFSHLLGASKTVALIASNISFPLMMPPILYSSLLIGRSLLGTDSDMLTLELTAPDLPAWIIGSLALATLVSIAGMILTLALCHQSRRWKRSSP